MTPLEQLLVARLATAGPMTLADYMAECLMHPDHGYYTQNRVFGVAGDFTTAPEISQMFGELIGLTLVQSWLDHGAPRDALWVELGPGRGTLMADMRRAMGAVRGAGDLPVHMIETSAQLRRLQAQAVPGVVHHRDLSTVPDGPIFLVANEFFDALPVRQFQRHGDGWCERIIGLGDGQLRLGRTAPMAMTQFDGMPLDSQVIETCPALPGVVHHICDRIGRFGGVALIIDYGHWQSNGDTVQALQNHAPVDILHDPGQCDITAHVDFAALAGAVVAPVVVSPMVGQGVFLERLGITARAQQLAHALTGPALDSHIAAHRRLTHPSQMGDLFKVMGLARTAQLLPAGLFD
ncbi:MAG: SAM-dependent methyltransferase [Pseudomonadota bacterium]